MSVVSVGEAGVSGLKLIGRRPLAVLAWGLVFLLLYGVPLVGMWASLMPTLADLSAHAGRQAAPTLPTAEMMAMMQRMQLVNLVLILGGMVARALIYCAICRAILEPEASAFGYLRLGARELWVGLVIVVAVVLFAVGMVIAVIALAIPLGIVGLIAHNNAIWPLLIAVGALSLLGLAVWVALRLSLAVPMTFATGQFRLFESWSATRGRVWSLLGAGLIGFGLLVVLEIVMFAVLGGVVFGVVMAGFIKVAHEGLAGAPFQNPAEMMRQIWPWMIAGAAVLCAFVGAAMAVLFTPFVTIYQALAPGIGADVAKAA